MTELETKVSEGQQDTELPSPEFSEAPVSPTSSLTPEAISELSKALTPIIEDTIDRKFKSTTDKRFSKLDKGNAVLTEVLANLKNQGVSIPKEVERDFALRNYIDERLAEREVSSQTGNGIPQSGVSATEQFDAFAVVNSLGLDTNDAEVRSLLSGKYRSTDKFEAEAAKLALRKAAKPTADATSAAPLAGGSSSQPDTAALTGQLAKLQKDPLKNKVQIAALEKQLGW